MKTFCYVHVAKSPNLKINLFSKVLFFFESLSANDCSKTYISSLECPSKVKCLDIRATERGSRKGNLPRASGSKGPHN